jgi:large subunit ribosomal protein L3
MSKRTGLIGTKIGNSSFYDDSGKSLPVTILKIDECIVSDIKTIEKHGYSSLQLVSINGKKEIKKLKKPQQKIFADLKINPKKIIKEFRVDQNNILDIGSTLDVSHFKTDQFVDVTSVSIGKGFAGAMKRHNFGGLRASHGVSISHRSHGSTGQNQDPGRVFKGKKMAGHMGATKVTIQNLKVVEVDTENNLLIIKGSVPGKKNATIIIKDSIKKN